MFPFKKKNALLPKHLINYILLQMVGITFLCVMLILNLFDYEFEWLKTSLLTFTFLAIVVYEVIINYWFYRVNKRAKDDTIVKKHQDAPLMEGNEATRKEKKGYEEKYLWFLFMLLIDVFIIIYLLSSYTPVHVPVSIILGILIFYGISMVVRPYFGVNNEEDQEKADRRKKNKK